MTDRIRSRLLVAALALIVGLAGCNTMEGLGEDIENTGDAIEDEAED